ncbi:MAG: hypothetical protein NTX25_13845, partial [Proteobacteria bacterium]|nr:hypothetical protein [Pseudomonadota bacterium]
PCEAGQVCGLSLASDDSWLISGYWGHYLGRDQQFKRLNIPISVSRGRGGVAIAHSGAAGLYIYLGADDGDQGTLPGLSQNLADAAVRTQSLAWMIWRGMDANLSSSPSLLQLELPKNSAQLAPQFLQMEVWKGVLPEPIPSDWIAWEAALPFAAPPWQSTPSASTDDDRWFLESIGAPRAWQLAAENGLIPAKIHAAVIDSGIDPAHPLLQRQLFHQALEIPDNGLDDSAIDCCQSTRSLWEKQ